MKKLIITFIVFFSFSVFSGTENVQAQVKEYIVPGFADFSGPYADIMPFLMPVREAVFKWWNETEGKALGVKLTPKNYDTRYDPSVVASLWPGILAGKPVVVGGLGGPDVAALQQRLPKDRVPVFYAPASYGYGWIPNQWIFQPRPTFVHEHMAALVWYIGQHPEKRPVKVATMASQASPAYIDIVKGVKKYIDEALEPKGLAKLVAQEWIDVRPVDVTAQLKSIIDKKADIITGVANTAQAGTLIRAEEQFGVSIPTIAAPHFTIWPLSMAMKTFKPWEGHYIVGAVVSEAESEGKAFDYFKLLKEKYGLNEKVWSPFGILGLTQSILMVRAVEHAAKKVGGANLSGQAIYDAMFEGPITEDELMGILPTLYYTKEAPFSTRDMKVKITTVKDGKFQLAVPGWVPVPADIKKW